MRCTAEGIVVEWRAGNAAWYLWVRWTNWPSRIEQEGALWIHGTLIVENEAGHDPAAALTQAADTARSQAEGAGVTWTNPAVIVAAPDLPEDRQRDVIRYAARTGWLVRPR